MIQSVRLRIALLLVITVAALGGYWFTAGAHAQPPWYHDFADQRCFAGVPHTLNVLSNLPFVLFGALGLWYMASAASERPGAFIERSERWPYWIYFAGLLLTGIGSAYYHSNPCNPTLTWDRLPLAIMFMGLFTGILAERVHVACSRWLLVPLVLFGALSVLHWDYTERQGAGDLRLYFTVQFFPLLAVPIMLLLYPPRYTGAGDLLASLLCYGLAKVLELLDHQVYSGGQLISGHSLKHLIAGLGSGLILLMLMRRVPSGAAKPAADVALLSPV